MALKEIEKLREKVDKDPNSKLFVPLAEEYKKEGMLDEAIQVLTAGIERQPGYMSARVSLGKIYLEKGMVDEARGEFENVIKSIPDNLYAHKKLAEIYRDSGEKELASKSYRTILRLNSMDEDAMSSLRELEEGKPFKEAGEQVDYGNVAIQEDVLGSDIQEVQPEEEPADFQAAGGDADAGPSDAPMDQDSDLSDFKASLFGSRHVEDEISEETVAEDLTGADSAENLAGLGEEGQTGDFSMDIQLAGEAAEEEEIHLVPEEISEDEDISSISSAQTYMPEDVAEGGRETGETYEDSFEVAEKKVSEGDYGGALRIYREVLSGNPEDRKALQRLNELRSLLKMLGKDKEELIARLNAFLEGLQKRHNEFFGRT